MAVTGLDHYNLRAPRPLLDELRAFYRDVVGLADGPRPAFNRVGFWLYAGGQPVLHLSEATASESRPAHSPNTFDHAAFQCVDFDLTIARLAAANIRHTVETVPGTPVRQIFLDDPAGNGVELNFADI